MSYNVTVQTPQYQVSSVDDLMRTQVTTGGAPQMLGNLAQARPTVEAAVMSRYNLRPAIDIFVSVEGRDLGGLSGDIQRLVEEARAKLPRGSEIFVRGQAPTMNSSYFGLGLGVAVSIVLVYLLVVVNFQSLMDALIIVSALPAALAGIVWMLFLTGTTLSRAGADRRDHDHGRRHRELASCLSRFAREKLRQGASRWRRRSKPERPASGRC